MSRDADIASPAAKAPTSAHRTAKSRAVDAQPARRLVDRRLLAGCGACLVSIVIHLLILVTLGLLFIPGALDSVQQVFVAEILEEIDDDELLKVELDQQLEAATEVTAATFSTLSDSGPAVSTLGAASPSLSEEMIEQFEAPEVSINTPTLSMPAAERLIEAVPDGAIGDERAIVDNYQQALDRITREIMWMLDRGDVLVIWCFDQSESMKDDQAEIRQRIDRVYAELGLTSDSSSQRLLTAVTSYGQRFLVHTPSPLSDRQAIGQAISAVPVDPSGHEMMCAAVSLALDKFRSFARGGRRQLALILVTDESGDRPSNVQALESVIEQAKSLRCRVYTLGREAVFGYPFAFMRWRHPQTNRMHWLRVDRGPETAFVEQLQINGFRRRHDVFSSGFGPYEQTRLSRESGGIFFMLPTVETAAVQRQKRRYELEAMHPFRPDLRARLEVLADRDRRPLRTLVWSVIHDLDPYNPQASRIIELRVSFSLRLDQFVAQARAEQRKAKMMLRYLAWAQKILEEGRPLREQEVAPRWRANYDLILAQVIGYQAKIFEYGASLDQFIADPQVAPATRSPNLRLVSWDVGTRKETLTGPISQPYIDRATEMLNQVIVTYAGTPWAERAKWELRRGFGVRLVPDYDPPHKKVANPIPIKKL